MGVFGVVPAERFESAAGVPAFAGTPLRISEGTNCRVDDEDDMK